MSAPHKAARSNLESATYEQFLERSGCPTGHFISTIARLSSPPVFIPFGERGALILNRLVTCGRGALGFLTRAQVRLTMLCGAANPGCRRLSADTGDAMGPQRSGFSGNRLSAISWNRERDVSGPSERSPRPRYAHPGQIICHSGRSLALAVPGAAGLPVSEKAAAGKIACPAQWKHPLTSPTAARASHTAPESPDLRAASRRPGRPP